MGQEPESDLFSGLMVYLCAYSAREVIFQITREKGRDPVNARILDNYLYAIQQVLLKQQEESDEIGGSRHKS